jgi:glutamine amidotransferase
MCRWFAYISPTEECLLEDVLITPAHSISKQVHAHYLPKLISQSPGAETTQVEISLRNRLQNVDGFGIAWYTHTRSSFVSDSTGPRSSVYKHSQPPTNDFNFHSICANTSTLTLFAHIRAATATAVTPINSHPFVFGRHTIMHNGVVANFQDIRRDLLDLLDRDAFENIKGTTDSEHMAALYVTHLGMQQGKAGSKASWERQYTIAQMKAALEATYTAIIELQRKKFGPDDVQASSLNVCCTDGERMIAFRFHNHVVEQPPSLYYSTTAGVTLNRKYPGMHDGTPNTKATKNPMEHGRHVIVASEPSTYKVEEWQLIPKNQAVLVDSDGSLKVVEIAVEKVLMATAPGEGKY